MFLTIRLKIKQLLKFNQEEFVTNLMAFLNMRSCVHPRKHDIIISTITSSNFSRNEAISLPNVLSKSSSDRETIFDSSGIGGFVVRSRGRGNTANNNNNSTIVTTGDRVTGVAGGGVARGNGRKGASRVQQRGSGASVKLASGVINSAGFDLELSSVVDVKLRASKIAGGSWMFPFFLSKYFFDYFKPLLAGGCLWSFVSCRGKEEEFNVKISYKKLMFCIQLNFFY